MTFENIKKLSSFLFSAAFILAFYIIFYVSRQKKKLSDEDILFFEKNIKPKILKLLLLICIPTFFLLFHALTNVGNINMTLILICTIASVVFTTSAYLISRQIVYKTGRQKEYNYITHYLFIMGITQLVLMTAVTSLFLETVN